MESGQLNNKKLRWLKISGGANHKVCIRFWLNLSRLQSADMWVSRGGSMIQSL